MQRLAMWRQFCVARNVVTVVFTFAALWSKSKCSRLTPVTASANHTWLTLALPSDPSTLC